jgi:hypothetical protein
MRERAVSAALAIRGDRDHPGFVRSAPEDKVGLLIAFIGAERDDLGPLGGFAGHLPYRHRTASRARPCGESVRVQ